MTVQKRLSQIGFSKQVGKGTAKTTPDYVVGLASGSVFMADVNENDLNTTWNDRALQGHDRESVIPGGDAEIIVTPGMIGLLLTLACGADAISGTGPYTHAITPATALPWHTLFGSYGSDKSTIADCKIDSLELSWDKTGALKCKVKSLGRTLTFASSWTGGTAEQVQGNVFKGAGGTFTIAAASARVISGTIKVENALNPIIAAYSVVPDEIAEGMVKCSVSMTIVPDDLLLFRTTVTGSAAGTTAATTPFYAALVTKWIRDANTDLTFTAPNAKCVVHMPDADPSGGAAEVTLEGDCAVPAGGGNPFSFSLKNAIAVAY